MKPPCFNETQLLKLADEIEINLIRDLQEFGREHHLCRVSMVVYQLLKNIDLRDDMLGMLITAKIEEESGFNKSRHRDN